MSHYVQHEGDWMEASSESPDPPYIGVDDDTATVHFVGAPNEPVSVSGAPVDPDADTIHTVMSVDSSLRHGSSLCAVYVRGRDLDLEDRRSPTAPPSLADAVSQMRSALDEILIPVYIDDAIEEISETIDGLVALHTVQHDDGREAPYTYFRTSIFQEGTLLLEEEHGSI